jgi:hypothetical protein
MRHDSFPIRGEVQETAMLSARENDLLTLTGPGTPMGDLLRR